MVPFQRELAGEKQGFSFLLLPFAVFVFVIVPVAVFVIVPVADAVFVIAAIAIVADAVALHWPF